MCYLLKWQPQLDGQTPHQWQKGGDQFWELFPLSYQPRLNSRWQRFTRSYDGALSP